MATLGELVLRRKLEVRENPIVGTIYIPGQHRAQIVGDDAIVSYVDGGGWAVLVYLQRDGDTWGMKTDFIICVNPFGIECRRVSRAFAGADHIVRALQETEARKKKAPSQQSQQEANSSTG